MRIIKIIFISLSALSLIVFTGIFILFQTFDTDQYLSQLTKKASLALGRPVSIGHAGLGFSWAGITLDAGPLIIADDAAFTTQPFIKVDRVRISPDLRHILFQSPQIHFIRSREGNINALSFGQKSQKNPVILSLNPSLRSRAGSVKGKELKTPLDSSAEFTPESFNRGPQNDVNAPHSGTINKKYTAFPAINIKIQDASISFIDQSQAMPLDIWLNGINASLNGFSFKTFGGDTSGINFSDLRLHADLSQLDIKDISSQMPNSPIFKNIRGQVQLNMDHLNIGASGNLEAKGDINITGVVIKNFNIFKTVLSLTLGVVGDIDGIIGKLGANDVIIEKAQAQFSYHNKTVFIDDSLIKTNIFEFKAQGSLDQGLNTDMQTMLRLNEDISAALVNELDGLKFLYDGTKRIAIGASLKGVIPHLKYKPDKDFRKKSKKALIEEGGNFLKNFLR